MDGRIPWLALVLLLPAACATSFAGDAGPDGTRPDAAGDDATAGDDGTADDDGAPACPPGTTLCGTECADLTSDAAHCGGCGLACPSGLVCNEGGCASTCSGLLTLCGASCVDTAVSLAHCGTCGHACPAALHADPTCSGARCGLACQAGWRDVDGLPGCECGAAAGDPCNGADDDCDGITDEGSAETCNALDDDCDGTTDDGFFCVRGATSTCSTSCGSLGTQVCSTGCALGPCTAPAEACNGRDDDCDGTCDDGFGCCAGATQGCTTSCGSAGSQSCSAGCTWDACSLPAETCNAADDDCDGTCDEGCRRPIHRSVHATTGDHLYTTDATEAACCGYLVESLNFFYLYNDVVAGTTAFYGCVLSDGSHFYTTHPTCEGSPGAIVESTLGAIGTSPFCGAVPLYRMSGTFGHFYTTSAAERDGAVASGWSDEGVAGYVWGG